MAYLAIIMEDRCKRGQTNHVLQQSAPLLRGPQPLNITVFNV